MIIYIILHSVLYKKTKCDRLYTILQKNGGTDTKAMGQTEPQFLPDPMSDRKKKFLPTLTVVWMSWCISVYYNALNGEHCWQLRHWTGIPYLAKWRVLTA